MTQMSGTETQALPTRVETAEESVPTRLPPDTRPLSDLDLARRLRLGSIELVGELWAITQKQVDAEISRQTRLEGKATSLLTAIGLSLTVAFTFGSTLLTQTDAFKEYKIWVVASYSCALAAGLLTAVLATTALLLFGQRQVAEDMVFNEKILSASDVDGPPEKEREGLMEYRKAAIIHLWGIRQRYDETYRQKSKLVKAGQIAFIAFLGALFSLCIPIIVAVISKG